MAFDLQNLTTAIIAKLKTLPSLSTISNIYVDKTPALTPKPSLTLLAIPSTDAFKSLGGPEQTIVTRQTIRFSARDSNASSVNSIIKTIITSFYRQPLTLTNQQLLVADIRGNYSCTLESQENVANQLSNVFLATVDIRFDVEA